MTRVLAIILLGILLYEPNASAKLGAAESGSTAVSMRHLVIFPYADVAADVTALDGTAQPEHRGQPIDLDDVRSYRIVVGSAAMRLDAHAMTVLMDRHILPLGNSPIKTVEVTLSDGDLHMSGTMVKLGVTLPFTATATLTPTQAGDIRIHMTSMRAGDVVPKSAMDFLGMDLSNIAQPANKAAFHFEGNDMIVPLAAMFPPPIFEGAITSLRVSPGGLYATVGHPEAASGLPDKAQPHSLLAMRGGTITFGRLTMRDADIAMVPLDPVRDLGFSPRDYYAQMLGGEVIPQADRGLVAHVTDFRDLPHHQ